ncbi:hypothetical protein SUGI_0032600 [Cryptomeria japonica]|uniref:photosynthetic NDH subunit of lumenal location 1, chloroplastic isoform X2 n=1 Tax=Cryptomeria japonica TaxID=3369 RepID=UPI0024089EA9|nr:photosynthetic NDH subunit of lumenal location 1, chloroplastic isoform X2 [Cryptomeria japonica]GLJ06159.1 hypothetical protein SUGI_0032600 [Cryptomeria japonica]
MVTLQNSPALPTKWSSCIPCQGTYLSRSSGIAYKRCIPSLLVVSAHTENGSILKHGETGRRQVLIGAGASATSIFSRNISLAVEVPSGYEVYLDRQDGYSFIYPSNWRDYVFRGQDAAFKDVRKAMENVRLSFVPTDKKDIHDLGPPAVVIKKLIKDLLATPDQRTQIFNIKEYAIDGKNYYNFDYTVSSRVYARRALVTLVIGNGKSYMLEVGTLERRWKNMEDTMQTISNSFTLFDV